MAATAEIHPFLFDEDSDELEIQFDPNQFRAVTPYTEDLDDEYQQAQEKLRELRQQEEQIKRQAAELEELTKKEQLFKSGRVEVCEELNRHLAALEQESAEARRRAEQCATAQERLEGHLANINALRPEMWSRADRKAELSRALGYIEAAEDEIEALLPVIDGTVKKGGFFGSISQAPGRGPSPAGAGRGDFLYWLKSGFAFSLPFVGFALIALVGFLFF